MTPVSPTRRRRLLSWRYARSAGPALDLAAAQRERVATVNRLLADGSYRMEHGPCVCGTHEADVVAEIDRYGLLLDSVLCRRCGSVRMDPYPRENDLAHFYGTHYQQMYGRVPDADAYFAKQRAYGQRLLPLVAAHVPKGGVVAEVGCGAGGALSVLAEAGYRVHGCDFAGPLIEFGRRRGLATLHTGPVAVLGDALRAAGQRADLIYLHHVFEHVHDPQAWLREAQALLADGGTIVVAVPEIAHSDRYPSPSGDLRQMLHIAHKYNFTYDGLELLAERAGLHARVAPVALSKQAPEMWVAFTHAPAQPAHNGEAVWRGDAKALRRRLRAIELGYLARAVARKLRGWVGLRPAVS